MPITWQRSSTTHVGIAPGDAKLWVVFYGREFTPTWYLVHVTRSKWYRQSGALRPIAKFSSAESAEVEAERRASAKENPRGRRRSRATARRNPPTPREMQDAAERLGWAEVERICGSGGLSGCSASAALQLVEAARRLPRATVDARGQPTTDWATPAWQRQPLGKFGDERTFRPTSTAEERRQMAAEERVIGRSYRRSRR